MNRREAIVGIGVLAAIGRAQAQSGRVPRVGVLHAGSSNESPTIQREPFERGLREHGWVPGSNILIDNKYAEGEQPAKYELVVNVGAARAQGLIIPRSVLFRADHLIQ